MARMYPSRFPIDATSGAERRVYDWLSTLEDGCRVFHGVHWQQKRCQGKRVGETDFVVLHPERPALVLEVKGGELRHTQKSGWEHRAGSGHRWRTMGDPIKQARDSQGWLHRLLAEHLGESGCPPVGYGLVWPDVLWKGALAPGIDAAVLLDSRSCTDEAFRRAVQDLQAYWRSRTPRTSAGLSPQAMEEVTELLFPQFELTRSLRSRIDETIGEVLRWTRDQTIVRDALRDPANDRMFVRGCTGSGKTLLALELAEYFAQAGASVLFLCHTRALAEVVQASLGPRWGRQVHVNTVTAWSERLASNMGTRLPADDDLEAFWKSLGAVIGTAVRNGHVSWDVLIVDEGQDFYDEWWAAVDEAQRAGSARRLYVFYDEDQAIYHECPQWLRGQQPVLPLRRNCRNPAPVAERAYEEGHISPKPEMPILGEAPVWFHGRSGAECARQASTDLRELLVQNGVPAGDVVVLSLRRWERSSAQRIELPGGYRVRPLSANESPLSPPGNVVRFSTAQAFKGLEANVVLLMDVDRASDATTPANLLVGMTRAKALLYVYELVGG